MNKITALSKDHATIETPQGNSIICQLDLLKPIILTEEWLIKFGFSYSDGVLK